MTLAWKHPFTCICASPSGCGKTIFVAKFLENLSCMIDHPINDIVWCCSPGSEPNISSARARFQREVPSFEDSSATPTIHNIFYQSAQSRNISLNAKYIVVFKNPRDRLQFGHLARQVYPEKSQELERVYKESTKEPFGYLVLDLGQDTDNRFRFRTKIFTEDETTTVFMHVNDE
ncbi:hypothetical protein J437_LFUL005969 [Ladona fulva]|uniref:Uncharacterized protein n=1 Tax=Ladona fulva TaxID=123851 RepID=A0A8K0NY78_LADFU|nr:hypothetical protein J437_LFUL005969 [Ladona fulva]